MYHKADEVGTQRDDDADALVGALVKVLDDVKGVRPWEQRLVLACWNVNTYPPFPPSPPTPRRTISRVGLYISMRFGMSSTRSSSTQGSSTDRYL